MSLYSFWRHTFDPFCTLSFPSGSMVEGPPANAGDAGDTGEVGSIPGSGRSPGGENDSPL